MSFVCLWIPGWPTGEAPGPELEAALLEAVPRVRIEVRESALVAWADARGLPARRVAESLIGRLRATGAEPAGVGVAAVPVAASVAARVAVKHRGGDDEVVVVEPGGERAFLADRPLELLGPDPRLRSLLAGVGVETCGELAALAAGAVEVRFGAEGLRLRRLARADDPRRLFGPVPRRRPRASLDFVDYTVIDPERLVFTANALLGRLCETLRSRGERARAVTLGLGLAGGDEAWHKTVRPARPTARREVWLRLLRTVFERLELPEPVTGAWLEVEATEPVAARQGDLFDRGFATAAAVERAVARLIEEQGQEHGPVVVAPETDAHPLAERRRGWVERDIEKLAEAAGPRSGSGRTRSLRSLKQLALPSGDPPASVDSTISPRLTLHLLPEPRPIAVETAPRRDHAAPVRWRAGHGWRALVAAAGPDRVSGGRWRGELYAREYFRCVSTGGVLLWLFRDARRDRWYLHGWWR